MDLIPIIPPSALRDETFTMFRLWQALAHGPEVPNEERDLFEDEKLIERICPTIIDVRFPEGIYWIGGAWQLQKYHPRHSNLSEYVATREAEFQELLEDSLLSSYDCGVVFQPFHGQNGVFVGMCHIVYGKEPPRNGGESLPVAA